MTEPQEQAQPVAEEPTPAETAPAPAVAEQEPQVVPGVGFLVMAFNDEKAADETLDAMKAAKKQKQFYFEDAAVIRQDQKGKVHFHETGDMGVGKGSGIGALVGGALALLGGPIGIALGAAIGAGAGALASTVDSGFRNESLNTVGIALKPGTSAVVAITSHAFLRAVQKQVPIEQIRETVSNLAANISSRLAEKKDMALGVILTEGGLVLKEIAVGDESVEVMGAVITDDAVIAGAAMATAEGAAYEVVAATAEGAAMEAGVITEEGAVIAQAVMPAALPAEAEAPAGENKAQAAKEETVGPADAAPAA